MQVIRCAVLAVLAVSAAPAAADQWEKTYRVGGRPALAVHTDDGSVTVETWNRPAIGVRIVTSGLKIGPRGLRVSDEANGDRVTIEAHEPRWSFSIGSTLRSIRVNVSVPRGTDLDIGTGDGSVVLDHTEGPTRIRTGDGSITAQGVKGDLGFQTGDGTIHGTDLEGRLVAETGDGSIRISGSFTKLDVETGDGSIDAAAETGPGPRTGWRFVTGDGSLVLRIPEDFKADLDAHTGDGGISLDFPIEVSGTFTHTTVQGTLNGGGPSLQLKSGNGSIRLGKF